MLCFLSISCLIIVVHGSAIITSPFCNETSGVYLRPGDVVTLICMVTNPGNDPDDNILRWLSVGIFDFFISNSAQDASNGIYSAVRTSIDNTPGSLSITSNLTFPVSEMDNGLPVQCRNLVQTKDTCTLLVCVVTSSPSSSNGLMTTGRTYQSVNLSWTAPIDSRGCDFLVKNYFITVTPSDGSSNPWTITTDSTSYTVTGLMFDRTYNFTVVANNSFGIGESSDTLTVSTLPGEVPDQVAAIDVCLNYTSSTGSFLNISWNSCPSGTPAANTTPPVNGYIISINGSSSNEVDNETYQVTVPLNDAEGDHTINVTVRNIVGINDTIVRFDSHWLQEVGHNASEATVYVTTVTSCLQTSEDLSIQLTYNNEFSSVIATSRRPYVANTTVTFPLTSLQPEATVLYTVQVINGANNTVGNGVTRFFMFTPPLPTPITTSVSMTSSASALTTNSIFEHI